MHELSQRFIFEAAHTLNREFESEGSRRIHGHTYHGEITVSGTPNPRSGMLVDLAQLRLIIDQVRGALDHRLLDEVEDLGPPTLENLCTFIANFVQAQIASVATVKVWREASGDSCRLIVESSSSSNGANFFERHRSPIREEELA